MCFELCIAAGKTLCYATDDVNQEIFSSNVSETGLVF